MKQEIRKVKYNNTDYLELCEELNNHIDKVVAEQRKRNANCLEGLERFNNVYIMYIADKIAGCVAFSDVEHDVIKVENVFVKEEYRSSGVATKLFENLENVAKGKGAKSLILDTYERLESAVKLYKKMGFKIVPQFEELKNSPYSLCMQKDL